jgi:hypothetical protein
MDILKHAREILMEQNPQEKDNLLEQLSQVLEYHHGLNEADIIEGMRLLLSAALQEDDKALRETFFSTIDTAVGHHNLSTAGRKFVPPPFVVIQPNARRGADQI